MHPHDLLCPARLFSRDEVLSRPSPISKSPGDYEWYFREIPPDVPTDKMISMHGSIDWKRRSKRTHKSARPRRKRWFVRGAGKVYSKIA